MKTPVFISIIEGEIRSRLNIRTSIMVHRLEEYCKKCPTSKVKGKYTGTCQLENKGCGCATKRLTSQNNKSCPLGFWANDWFKEKEFNEYLKLEQNG